MKPIRDWSVKRKLSLIVLLACSMATLASFIIFINYEVRMIRGEMVDNLTTQAAITGANCIEVLDFDDKQTGDKTLGKLSMDKNIIAARIYKKSEDETKEDELFAVFIPYASVMDTIPPREIPEVKSHHFGEDYLQVFYPIISESERIGMVELIMDLSPLKIRTRNQVLTAVGVLFVSLFFAFLLASRLIRVICNPILHLSETAQTISSDGNYAVRSRKHGNDELGKFIEVFNDMLDQIQERDIALQKARDELEDRVKRRTAELHRINEELQQANEQLRELDKMKSAFVSQASHDLRTPLTTIKINLDNLLRGVGGGLNEKQKKLMERAQGAVNRLTNLINDVLDLNRIESGRMILEKIDVPFNVLVYNVMKENQPAADQKQISLQCSIPDEIYAVNVDVGKMERVVGELVGNAIKYTPKNGNVHVRLHGDDQQVMLTVKDSGIGMTKEECEKIWERFYRTAASRQIAVGSGLGLSIAKELTEMHEGRLAVESEFNQGSCFTLTLPLIQR
ncbi:MAG: HAMP domain-containing protein [Candidatus Omnitrophota bacterium]|jgi:signal transduction histidine kinase|nr:MAG: HAMP domain-containing protein [Candidatus Omnitrophota bacterium]